MSWQMVKLKDCCEVVGGATPKRNIVSYWGGDIPWITPKDVSNLSEPYIYEAPEYITKTGYKAAATYMLPVGTILLTSRAPIGNVAIAGIELCTNQGFKSLIPGRNVHNKYLYHCIKKFVPQLELLGNGATFKEVSKKVVENFEIPLPPFEEQKRIADILDKADSLRQKREQAMKLANDFLRTTFLNMFGDPVENPKKLKKAPITELAEVITGFAFKSNQYISDAPESVRLCRGANTLTGYLDWADTKFWPKNKLEKLDNYLIKAGDIILAMDRPWISSGLKVCIFPENQRETYLVQRVARLRPRCESYTNYIYSCIKSPAFEKHCCPTETTVPHISPVELKNFEVLIPPDELMANFHSIVSIINNSLNKMASGDIDSDALFSKLSQQAFSGHLKR
ncbi:restriction endonuclease subunit S [Klebsiella pneumoniae]|nr:restriction endonuclease subunit S [Klebsiella pneumoniae]